MIFSIVDNFFDFRWFVLISDNFSDSRWFFLNFRWLFLFLAMFDLISQFSYIVFLMGTRCNRKTGTGKSGRFRLKSSVFSGSGFSLSIIFFTPKFLLFYTKMFTFFTPKLLLFYTKFWNLEKYFYGKKLV